MLAMKKAMWFRHVHPKELPSLCISGPSGLECFVNNPVDFASFVSKTKKNNEGGRTG